MKLEIVRAGGLAGVATRTELDADALDAEAAASFAGRVRESGLLARPPQPPERGAAPRHPDELLYELTAQEQGHAHTQRYAEAELPEDVRELIAWVDGRPERSEAIEPPGSAPA